MTTFSKKRIHCEIADCYKSLLMPFTVTKQIKYSSPSVLMSVKECLKQWVQNSGGAGWLHISRRFSQLCFCGWFVFLFVLLCVFFFSWGCGRDGKLWRAGSQSNSSGLISFSVANGEQMGFLFDSIDHQCSS